MLHDRLVVGINDLMLQRRLLAKPRLTLKKAIKIALAHETELKDSKVIQEASGVAQAVNQVTPTKQQPMKSCYHCGKSNHKVSDCYYKETICSSCKKKGHLAKACCNRTSTNPPSTPGRQRQNKSIHFVEDTLDSQNDPSEYSLFTVNNCVQGKGIDSNLFIVNVLINKQPVGMQSDTDAAVSIMFEATYQQLWSQGNGSSIETTTATQLSTSSGDILETLGTVTCDVEYQNQKCQLPLVVVKHPGPTLLGRNWLYHIRIDWPQLTKQVLSVHFLTNLGQEVFSDELGTFTGPKVKLITDPQVTPKLYKPRSLPYAMRDMVEQQLKSLQAAGIIEPIQSCDWAAPIVSVLKCDKKTTC